MRRITSVMLAASLVVAVVIGTVAAYSYVGMNPLSSSTGVGIGACSQPRGVVRVQLEQSPKFGAVTSYPLPSPLKAPNSITIAPDGSVWFGEVGLRGVGHLYANGTLIQYAWPPDSITPQTNCFDISELWGVALWHGLVWSTDGVNNRILGLNPSNDTFRVVDMEPGTVPRYLTVDDSGHLWFTASSVPTRIGEIVAPGATPTYFQLPTSFAEITASITVYNTTLAYVAAVDPSDNMGQVFSFDPSSPAPSFTVLGRSQSLLGPYSAALVGGTVWASEHDASGVVFLNSSSSNWVFVPTSVNPEVALTLPYYLAGNGSSLWFNEQTGNRIAVLDGQSLTEFNISSKSMAAHGIENALTLAVHGDLAWFTEWTGNAVGFVNASVSIPFSISSGVGAVSVSPGSSSQLVLSISGQYPGKLGLEFADSETHLATPDNMTVSSNLTVVPNLSGTAHILVTLTAKPSLEPGFYLLLATVTDGVTYRSVYVPVRVS